jgi:hypothetical protein
MAAPLEGGTPFDQALTKTKLKTTVIKPFSQKDPPSSDTLESSVRDYVKTLAAGTLTPFESNTTGGFFAYVKSREPAKPEEISKIEPQIRDRLLNTQKQNLFEDFHEFVVAQGLAKEERQPLPAPNSPSVPPE